MKVKVRVDSKGRILLPKEVREELGDVIVLEKTDEGYILKKGKGSFLEEFKEVISSEPPREGKPENWPPSKIKGIWVSE